MINPYSVNKLVGGYSPMRMGGANPYALTSNPMTQNMSMNSNGMQYTPTITNPLASQGMGMSSGGYGYIPEGQNAPSPPSSGSDVMEYATNMGIQPTMGASGGVVDYNQPFTLVGSKMDGGSNVGFSGNVAQNPNQQNFESGGVSKGGNTFSNPNQEGMMGSGKAGIMNKLIGGGVDPNQPSGGNPNQSGGMNLPSGGNVNKSFASPYSPYGDSRAYSPNYFPMSTYSPNLGNYGGLYGGGSGGGYGYQQPSPRSMYQPPSFQQLSMGGMSPSSFGGLKQQFAINPYMPSSAGYNFSPFVSNYNYNQSLNYGNLYSSPYTQSARSGYSALPMNSNPYSSTMPSLTSDPGSGRGWEAVNNYAANMGIDLPQEQPTEVLNPTEVPSTASMLNNISAPTGPPSTSYTTPGMQTPPPQTQAPTSGVSYSSPMSSYSYQRPSQSSYLSSFRRPGYPQYSIM